MPDKPNFIWSEIETDATQELILLQSYGFYIVDTRIKLLLSKKIHLVPRSNIRFANLNDELQVKKLAKNAFIYSRFNRDPKISEDIAGKIKEKWAGNYFIKERGNWMVVVENNGKIIGFLQLIDKDDNTNTIDLIAVDENYRGQGLAKEMIKFAQENCSNKEKKMEVGTQISNISSLNMYMSLDFKIKSAFYILHRHQ